MHPKCLCLWQSRSQFKREIFLWRGYEISQALLTLCVMQGADALERAHRVKTVVFDKTGTLTKGRPVVAAYRLFNDQVCPQSLPQALFVTLEGPQQRNQWPVLTHTGSNCLALLPGALAECFINGRILL